MARTKYIDITPTQYAAMYGCELNVITYRIRKSLELPHVKYVKQFGRFYLLSVPESLTASTFYK